MGCEPNPNIEKVQLLPGERRIMGVFAREISTKKLVGTDSWFPLAFSFLGLFSNKASSLATHGSPSRYSCASTTVGFVPYQAPDGIPHPQNSFAISTVCDACRAAMVFVIGFHDSLLY